MRVTATITATATITSLALAALTFTLPAAAEEPSSPSTAKPVAPVVAASIGGPVAPTNVNGLTRINGGLTADGARAAGQSRNVDLGADTNAPATAKPVRPVPSPRVLRKLGSERVVASIEPSVAACSTESKSNAPTAFGIRVAIGPDGEVESAELASSSDRLRPPPALVACVVTAVKTAKFGAPGASGASIVVPITVPGRPASAGVAVAETPKTTTTVSVIGATPSTAPTLPTP